MQYHPPTKARKSVRIVVYVTRACTKCKLVKEWLKSQGVPSTIKDIVQDPKAMRELAELTGGRVTVPAVAIGTRVVSDPSWKKLQEFLRRGP